MKVIYCILCFWSISGTLVSQGLILPAGDPSYEILDRWDILYNSELETPFISSIKNYQREWMVQRAKEIDSTHLLSAKNVYDLTKVLLQNNEWKISKMDLTSNKKFVDSTEIFYAQEPGLEHDLKNQFDPSYYNSKKPILKYFYRDPAHLLSIDKPGFTLRVNPIIHFKYGSETNHGTLFQNQRGIEIRGGIDQKIFFQSRILESQTKFPVYIEDFIKTFTSIPGNGLYKGYNSNIFKIEQGYDYLNADAFVGFNFTKHVGAQLGYGKQFLGNGLRSLFLADFANNFFYLKLNTQIWKFHYQNIFGEINSESANFPSGDLLVPKKYFAAHYLGLKLRKNLDVGIFETVVFNRDQFEFQYLNPIIFYRSIEHNLGSPDNVLIGIDVKWNLFNTISVYSQILFDEFKLNELITDNQGWWANKYGLQFGIKYINAFGIDHLDAQIEINAVRPYTYSHRDSTSNYSHSFQSLAHPLGANLREGIFKITYRPINKLTLSLLYWTALKGNDDTNNWGGNILLPNATRTMNFNNKIGQGVETNYDAIFFSASYELFHNVYLDLDLNRRTQNDLKTSFFTTGIRMNLGKESALY